MTSWPPWQQPLSPYQPRLGRDLLTAIDAATIDSRESFMQRLRQRQVEDTVTVEFVSRGQSRTASMMIRQIPRLDVVTFESTDMTVTDHMRTFRRAWLGSRAP